MGQGPELTPVSSERGRQEELVHHSLLRLRSADAVRGGGQQGRERGTEEGLASGA